MKKYFSMFRFYYYVYKGSAKKYDIAMDTDTGEGFIASFTPMALFILHIFSALFATSAIFTLSMFLWIPVILGNLTIVHNVGREGRNIKWAEEEKRREAEREERDRIRRAQEKERQRRQKEEEERMEEEWKRVYRDFFNRMNEEAKREKSSHRQTQQKSYTSKLDSALTFLGLSRGATKDDVKKAYRKLAKKHHPDMGGNEKDFIKLKEHYDYAMSQL